MLRQTLFATAAALVTTLAAPPPLAAQDMGTEAPSPAEAAIAEVISSQLDAFNSGDVAAAWDHASPMIKGIFGTPQNFGRMVERGYPMVWRNSGARFTSTREAGDSIYQRVIVSDAEGAIHALEYKMIQTPEGWQIDGVSIVPAPELGV